MTESVSTLSIWDLLCAGNLELLEQTWLEELEEPGPIEQFLLPLTRLIEDGKQDLAASLAASLLDALSKNDRQKDIQLVFQRLAEWKLKNLDGLEKQTASTLKEMYGSQPYFSYLLSKVDLDFDADELESMDWDSFCMFYSCTSYLPGKPVLHTSGWGEGIILDLHQETDEVTIEFTSGKVHSVPWQTAVDTLKTLPADDLRAMKLTDPEGLSVLAKEKPVEIIRRALKLFRGTANSAKLKELLHGKILPERSWASWWKKAKAAAIEDPLIEVGGSSARPVFTLRKNALTLLEEARSVLKHENVTSKLVQGLQTYLDRCTRSSDREDLRAYAGERLLDKARVEPPDAESVEALVFLLDLEQVEQAETLDALKTFFAIDASGGSFVKIAQVGSPRIRQRIIEQTPRLLGNGWHEIMIRQLKVIPEDCLERILELIIEENTSDSLLDLYESAAPFPKKHPVLLFLLTKLHAEGRLGSSSAKLDPNIVCRVIIHVLRLISETRKGDAELTKLQNRMVTLLMGRRNLLAELLQDIDEKTMGSIVRVGARGGNDYPPKLQEMVERSARERFPEIFELPEKPFWEEEGKIYSTREGLAAYEKDFRELMDIKIPENSKAIGSAASMGDLSENAEWEAAIAEQRNLTNKATEMEANLKRVKLIADQDISEGVVAPGTRIVVLDVDADVEESYRIMGPWDSVHGDDVISYLAPLAKALLGRTVEEEVVVELPSGPKDYRIQAVEVLKLN